MNKRVLMLSAGMLAGAAFAKPSISAATAQISSAADEINFTYTVKESGKGEVESDCRSVDLLLFANATDAKAYARQLGKADDDSYEDASVWQSSLEDPDETSAGQHTASFGAEDALGLSAKEFLKDYPKPVALIVVSDTCEETYAYKQVTVSAVVSTAESNITRYKKAQTLTGAFSDGEDSLLGTVSLALGAANKKTGAVKVKATITSVGAKLTKVSASATAIVDEDGALSGILKFKQFGEMSFSVGAGDDEYGALTFEMTGEGYSARPATVGGAIDADELTFGVDRSDAIDFGDDYDELDLNDAPDGEVITVRNGSKLSCAKAASIKYVKYREDGETYYELTGLDDETKTNYAGLTVSYAVKTGIFKGSFYVYATNEGSVEGKPTLKKYKATFTGVVIDGVGTGVASVKVGKTTYSWGVTLGE